MARRFERPLLMAGVASGGAPAPGSTLEAVVGAGDPPPQVVAWCGSLWSSRATVVTRSATMARVGARRRSPKGKAFIGDLA
jgi:hypothetical protein